MTTRSATTPFPARIKSELQIDPVLLTIVVALLLGGFVILASASISISDSVANNPFFYVQRQLIAAVIGTAAGFVCLLIPMQVWQKLGPLVLLVGLALLVAVLLPGLGYEVNGATRWVLAGIMNLQVSEPARLCFLLYLAGYLVRRNKSLREEFTGFLWPMIVLTLACVVRCMLPNGSAYACWDVLSALRNTHCSRAPTMSA